MFVAPRLYRPQPVGLCADLSRRVVWRYRSGWIGWSPGSQSLSRRWERPLIAGCLCTDPGGRIVDSFGPFQFIVNFSVSERQIGHLEVFEEDASDGEGFPPSRNVLPLVLSP